MRARLHDPHGPIALRGYPWYLGAVLALLFAVFSDLGAELRGIVAIAGAMLFNLPVLIPRFRPRDVEVVLGAGYIDVKGAGLRRQRIRARDVTGASTALLGSKIVLSLARKGRRDIPIALELDALDDVKAIRDALGVGHDGFGTVLWPSDLRSTERQDAVFSASAFLLNATSIALVLASVFEGDSVTPWLVLTLMGSVGATILGLLLRMSARKEVSSYVAMRADGLHVYHHGRWQVLPYNRIAAVEEHHEGLMLMLHGNAPYLVNAKERTFYARGLSKAERQIVIAQVTSAAQRAQGRGTPKPETETRIDVLKRNGETPHAWFARLDVTAQTLLSGGYRGGSNLSEQDLWTLVEDHDADLELRTGAARVLVKARPENQPRVDTLLAAIRDEADQKRVRVALDPDLEAAGREFEELEERQLAAQIRR
jgi:hypothetical protein